MTTLRVGMWGLLLILGCRSETTGLAFGSPTQLAFQLQPVNTAVGQSLSVTVEIQDAEGRLVTNATRQVTIQLNGAASMAGLTTVNAVGGVATFNQLYIVTPGTGYKLVASAPLVNAVTSQPFSIVTAAIGH